MRPRCSAMIVAVGCLCLLLRPIGVLGATSQVTFSAKAPVPLQPIFATLIEDAEAVAGGSERVEAGVAMADGTFVPARILPLSQFGRRGENRITILLVDLPKTAAGKDVVLFRQSTQKKREELARVTVRPLEDLAKQGDDLWDTVDTFLLVARCLERSDTAVAEPTREVLRRVAAQAEHKAYQRTAKYIIGCLESERLEKQFNNNGPVGAFRPCYPMLEAVDSTEGEDPLWLDAQMRLLRAKAWSSDYDDAKAIAQRVSKSGLSEKYSRIAERGVAEEFPKLEKKRQRVHP